MAERDEEPPIEELWTDITDDAVGTSKLFIPLLRALEHLLIPFLAFLRSANYENSVFPDNEIL